MKRKILFIINPISGAGKQRTAEKLIGQKLNPDIFDPEIAYTKAPKHAIELSKRGVQEGFDIIVAVGGDGSVNEVGKGLIGSNSTLAVLPCGSGNGAARHLKISMHMLQALATINRGKSSVIDTFTVNDEPVINTAGIGFAAHIAHEFSRLKKRGFNNYLKIALRDSLTYKSQRCQVEIKNPSPIPGSTEKTVKMDLNAFIIDIANGSQWGNNAVIAPHAENSDGLLDLCVVRHFPFINFPVMATRLFTNSIHRSKFVEIKKITEAVIHQENDYAHIDGEPVMIGKELRVKIHPLSLKVIIP